MASPFVADVAVVGAGPAGLAAACRAAEAGAATLLLDEGPAAGGQIWRTRPGGDPPRAARDLVGRLVASGVQVLTETTVIDATPGALLGERRGEAVRARAPALILATGARELFLPFPGWTLPGVLGVGAGQALLKSGASVRGRRVVIAGSGPLLLPVAALMTRAGARVELVAEQATGASVARFALGLIAHPGKVRDALAYRWTFRGTPFHFGTWVVEAVGDDSVRGVVLRTPHRSWTVACDLLCCAYGLIPNTELQRLLGCRMAGGTVVVDDDQQTSVPGVYCAGEPTGVGGVDAAIAEGEVAGWAAAGRGADARMARRRARRGRRFERALLEAFRPRSELRDLARGDTVVCRCEDVPRGRLEPGWDSRTAKLYTRAGMGPCQGRICGPALELLFGWEADTVRCPSKPARLGTLLDL